MIRLILRRYLGPAILVALAVAACWLGGTSSAAALSEEQQVFARAWRIVNRTYWDENFNGQNWWFVRQDFLEQDWADREQTYQAIERMLATLDDPFTRLLRPDRYRNLQVNTSGELSGVGLQIDMASESGAIEVVAPIDGSPAAAAGIEPRDRILAVDGVSTSNLSLDEAATRMRGPSGSRVRLTVEPASAPEASPREIELVRDRISLSPVRASLDRQSAPFPVGYLRLAQFSANARSELAQALSELEEQGAQGYVLDLRSNPGGLLQAGIEAARLWLDEGEIVQTVAREGTVQRYRASGDALTEAPLVVLIDRGSASASEILAGALQDNGRATLVGERTFGKGSVQSLFELPDEAGLAVTVAKYETPSRRDIDASGIVPDRVVSQEPLSRDRLATEDDRQYRAAIRCLQAQSVPAEAAP